MGLDNGFVIKNLKGELLPKSICKMRYWHEDKNVQTSSVEFGYFRKCWNLRSEVLDALGGEDNEVHDYDITSNNIDEVIKALSKLNHKKYWESDNYGSYFVKRNYWEFKEIKHPLRKCIRNLKKIKKFLKTQDSANIQIYFYDSY